MLLKNASNKRIFSKNHFLQLRHNFHPLKWSSEMEKTRIVKVYTQWTPKHSSSDYFLENLGCISISPILNMAVDRCTQCRVDSHLCLIFYFWVLLYRLTMRLYIFYFLHMWNSSSLLSIPCLFDCQALFSWPWRHKNDVFLKLIKLNQKASFHTIKSKKEPFWKIVKQYDNTVFCSWLLFYKCGPPRFSL